jgi:hypothetical protein
LEGVSGLPCDQAASLMGLNLAAEIDRDLEGKAISLMTPSFVTTISDLNNDELGTDEVIDTSSVDLPGGVDFAPTRGGYKIVRNVPCDGDGAGGFHRGVTTILKPSNSISSTHAYRILEKMTQATPDSGWYVDWVAQRVKDVSDTGGAMVQWDANEINDYGSGQTLSLSVGLGGFSSSASWTFPQGRAGGYRDENDNHFSMQKVGSGGQYSKSVKSETMFRYPKPAPRKSWFIPCGASFYQP